MSGVPRHSRSGSSGMTIVLRIDRWMGRWCLAFGPDRMSAASEARQSTLRRPRPLRLRSGVSGVSGPSGCSPHSSDSQTIQSKMAAKYGGSSGDWHSGPPPPPPAPRNSGGSGGSGAGPEWPEDEGIGKLALWHLYAVGMQDEFQYLKLHRKEEIRK